MAIKIGNTEFKGIKKRGNSYQVSIYYLDENGVNQRDYSTFKPTQGMTEKELEKALQTYINEKEKALNLGVVGKPPKFKEVAFEWAENEIKLNYAIGTYDKELSRCKRVCGGVLGDIRIDKINGRNVQNYLNSLTKDGANQRNGKGLESGTIKKLRTFIINVMEYAKDNRLVTSNPIRYFTKVPKQKHKQKSKNNFNMFSEIEMLAFKRLLEDTQIPIYWRCFFFILLSTGARKGEILALEFDDFIGNRVHFDRSVVHVKEKGTVTNPDMKTPNSHRFNILPDEVIDLVNELKVYQDDKRRKLGDLWVNKNNRLFTYWDGRQMNLGEPNNFLTGFIKKHSNKLHHVNIHSFRHLFVSCLVDNGYTAPQIAAIIGDTPATVNSTYSHFFKRAEKETEAPAYSLSIFAKNQY